MLSFKLLPFDVKASLSILKYSCMASWSDFNFEFFLFFIFLFIYLLQYSTVQYNALLTILHYISLAANYIQYLGYLPYFPYIISLFPSFFFFFFCITLFNSLQNFINLQYVIKTKIFIWIIYALWFLLLVQGQLNRKEKIQIYGENIFSYLLWLFTLLTGEGVVSCLLEFFYFVF